MIRKEQYGHKCHSLSVPVTFESDPTDSVFFFLSILNFEEKGKIQGSLIQ